MFIYHHNGTLLTCDDSETARDGCSTGITKYINTQFTCYSLATGGSATANTSATNANGGSGLDSGNINTNTSTHTPTPSETQDTTTNTTNTSALPPLFQSIQQFEPCNYILPGSGGAGSGGGYYLVAIFGENYISKSAYTISVVTAKNNSTEIQHIEAQDKAMLQMQKQIADLQCRYIEVYGL